MTPGARPASAAPARGEVAEEERVERGHENLPRRGRRQRERRIRASVAGGEAVEPERRGDYRDAAACAAEDGDPCLPDDEEGGGWTSSEDSWATTTEGSRPERSLPTSARGSRAKPEREGVPGVEAAARELVDGAQVEVADVVEHADDVEVEEGIADDGARDLPEQQAEEDAAGEQHGPTPLVPGCRRRLVGGLAAVVAARERRRRGRRLARRAAISTARSRRAASQTEPCTVKTTAQATNCAASAQASVAEAAPQLRGRGRRATRGRARAMVAKASLGGTRRDHESERAGARRRRGSSRPSR